MFLYQGSKLKQIKPYPIDETFVLNTVGLDFRVLGFRHNIVRLYKNIFCTDDDKVGEMIIDVQEDLIEEYFQSVD